VPDRRPLHFTNLPTPQSPTRFCAHNKKDQSRLNSFIILTYLPQMICSRIAAAYQLPDFRRARERDLQRFWRVIVHASTLVG
jgi:hypothetical protein